MEYGWTLGYGHWTMDIGFWTKDFEQEGEGGVVGTSCFLVLTLDVGGVGAEMGHDPGGN